LSLPTATTRRKRGRRVWLSLPLTLLSLLLSGAIPFSASAQQAQPGGGDEESEGETLRRLRESILQSRDRVGQHERDEREIFDRLEEIARGIDGLVRRVAEAKREADRARDSLRDAKLRETDAAKHLSRTRAAMSKRVVALYKSGEVGPLRVLFAASSLPDLLERASVLQLLLEYDASLVTRFRGEHDAFGQARLEAKELAASRQVAVADLKTRSAQLAAERSNKTELLAMVREDRTRERALLVEYERAARALEEKLVALGESSGGGGSNLDETDFEAHKGRLEAPVDAPISMPFGKVVDAEYLTETFRKGVEFDASSGDSVRAVAFGEVRYTGWFRGYGKIVILDHGNQYFSVSGHLSEIYVDVGKTVDVGDTLGSVGETGSLAGPSLYFEVRRAGQPLDPEDWLER